MLKINNQLQKINTTSLAKVIFYKEPFQEFIKRLSMRWTILEKKYASLGLVK